MGVQYGHLSLIELATQNSRFRFTDIRQMSCKTGFVGFPASYVFGYKVAWT
jgi:hypothetical protein